MIRRILGAFSATFLAIASASAQNVGPGVFNPPQVGDVGGLGTGVATALGIAVGGAGAPVTNGGALGTPSSGTGVGTFLGTASSANLAAALTDETGTGAAMFATGPTLGSVAWVSLPSAGNAGRIYRVSNMGASGSLWVDNGTRWRTLAGEAILASRDTSSSTVANSETCTFQYQLPAASWQLTDRIRVYVGITKSGTTDTGALKIRIGTAGTTSDTSIFTGTVLAAGDRQFARFFDLRLEDATHVQLVAQGANPIGWGGTNSTNAYPSSVAISNVSNSLYVSACINSSSTNDTLTNVDAQMWYLSSAN
jgi:hypothetical protein